MCIRDSANRPHKMFRTAVFRSARCIAPRAQAPIVRRATPSAFFPSKIVAPSASIPSIRFYSAHAGLSKDEVQGRIVDLLKNFDKVRVTKNCCVENELTVFQGQ